MGSRTSYIGGCSVLSRLSVNTYHNGQKTRRSVILGDYAQCEKPTILLPSERKPYFKAQ